MHKADVKRLVLSIYTYIDNKYAYISKVYIYIIPIYMCHEYDLKNPKSDQVNRSVHSISQYTQHHTDAPHEFETTSVTNKCGKRNFSE